MEAAENMAEVEPTWEALLDLLPMGACVVGRDLVIVQWNQTIADWTGLPRLKAIGTNLGVLAPDVLSRRYHARIMDVFDLGTPAVFSSAIHKRFLPAPSRQGSRDELMIQQTIIRLLHNGSGLALVMIQDVTSEYQQLKALRHERLRAEQANRSKSEFLANMSHEIRTPINGVIGMTELMLGNELTSDLREHIELIKISADSLLTVIDDILDFSKIEAGKLDLESVDFALRDLVASTLKPLALRANAKGLELACRIGRDVPDGLVGDPGRLRQVLTNLIGNAIKFTEHGEVALHVERTADQGGRVALRFVVSDTGIGIPSEKQRAIFRPFEQADGSTTRRFGGTGLGLAISRRLVEMMKGQIGVESVLGRGSTFDFTVSLEAGGAGVPNAASVCPHDRAGFPALIVDDNPTCRLSLAESLAELGFAPTSLGDARLVPGACERAAADGRPYRIALIDAAMPEADGFDLAARLLAGRAEPPSVILLLSSSDRQRDLERCRQIGAHHLHKPVLPGDLIVLLRAAAGPPATVEPARLCPASTGVAAASARPLRVLLAEDNLINQKVAVNLLRRMGHETTVAANGREAMSRHGADPFDLILMDLQMPEMDGFEAVTAIRTRERRTGAHIPIIALTAHAMMGDRERCLNSGFDGYLTKPIRAAELFQAIEDFARESLAAAAAHAGDSVTPAFDQAAALESIGGDRGLYDEIARLFLDDAPRMRAQIRETIHRRDAQALRRAAHSLKGAATHFAAQGVIDAAERLEHLGKSEDFVDADVALAALERAFDRVLPALKESLTHSIAT